MHCSLYSFAHFMAAEMSILVYMSLIVMIGSEEGRKRQKEFFRAELTRLQKSLKDESSKIHKPKQ
jgi:hypothetical protein